MLACVPSIPRYQASHGTKHPTVGCLPAARLIGRRAGAKGRSRAALTGWNRQMTRYLLGVVSQVANLKVDKDNGRSLVYNHAWTLLGKVESAPAAQGSDHFARKGLFNSGSGRRFMSSMG